ncbi:hypothetical protein GH714_021653 [Hevea brasiliensis]|uniref:Uncharacterized protein n=1 Tax=Hevea brasiliensis TaxID=3981 RepID=A0A6A6K8Q3_HEVBR|nr:hypothetical protein GH714_021653 [Hevea brasiliensis]
MEEVEEPEEELGAMKEMMYKIAAMQPVDIDPATIRKPKRRNIRLLQSNQNPPCIGGWKPLVSTTSSTLESPAPAGPGNAFLSNGGDPAAMCFNHEVISD